MASADESDAAHFFLLSEAIGRFLKDPTTAPSLPSPPAAPPGAPIGQWPQDYLAGSEWIVEMGFGAASNPWLDSFDLGWGRSTVK